MAAGNCEISPTVVFAWALGVCTCLSADKYKCKQRPRQLQFSEERVRTLLPNQPSANRLMSECLPWVFDETWHVENIPSPSIQSVLKLAQLVQLKGHLAKD